MSDKGSPQADASAPIHNFNTLLASIEKMTKRFDKLEEDFYASDVDEDDNGMDDSFTKAKGSKRKLSYNPNTGHDLSESDNDDPAWKIKDKHRSKKCKTEQDSDDNLDPAQAVTKAYKNDPDFKELLDVYNSTKPKALADPLTDLILEPLTKILESWFWGHYSSTEKAKTKQPANATALILVQINEELYHSISPDGKLLDRPFHYIQNALGKGAQLLVLFGTRLFSVKVC